jgi:hypothetical protein
MHRDQKQQYKNINYLITMNFNVSLLSTTDYIKTLHQRDNHFLVCQEIKKQRIDHYIELKQTKRFAVYC